MLGSKVEEGGGGVGCNNYPALSQEWANSIFCFSFGKIKIPNC